MQLTLEFFITPTLKDDIVLMHSLPSLALSKIQVSNSAMVVTLDRFSCAGKYAEIGVFYIN